MIILLFLCFGVFIGFVGGLFGIGGGTIAGPLLLFSLGYLGVEEEIIAQTAIFTSLAVVMCTSMVSTGTHWHYQKFALRTFGLLAVGLVIGSILGSLSLIRLDGMVVKLLLGSFLLMISYAMGIGSFYLRVLKNVLVRLPLMLVAIFTGSMASLLGIGGGIFHTPILMGRGLDIKKAIGTSSACNILIGLTAVISSMVFSFLADLPILHYIYLPAFIPIALTASFFANLGARTAQKMDRMKLRRLFAIFLLSIAGYILLETLIGL